MLIFILGINVIMFVVILGIYYSFSKKIVLTQTQEKAMEKVHGVVSILEGYLNEKSRIAWTFFQNPVVTNWLENNSRRVCDRRSDPVYGQIVDYLDALVKRDGEILSAFISSERVKMYWDNAERAVAADYRVDMRPWYINAVKKGKPSFDVDVDATDKYIAVNYRFPMYNAHGKLLGVGGIDIVLERFKKFMSELDHVFETGESFLVGGDGMILYHPDEKLVLKKRIDEFEDDGKEYKNMGMISKKIISGQEGIDPVVFSGERRYFMYKPIKNLGWTLVLSVSESEINAPLRSLARTSFFIIIVTSVFLVLAVIFITGTITKPIHGLVAMLKDIAEGEGDLTKRMEINAENEVGEMAKWFNRFVDKLHDIVFQVKVNIKEVAAAADEISSTSAQMASGAEEQTTQATQVAASVQEMTTAIIQNSKNAIQSAKITEQAKAEACEGAKAMQATQEEMDEIVESTARTGNIIQSLSGRAGQIGEIIQAIDDIADQTNLLALNAAIEAARAGEQGQGFAVVADEVRKLAERTTTATKEIVETIQAIQEDTKEASLSMAEAYAVVNKGKMATVKTETVLNEIIASVTQAMDIVGQIATASEQMSSGAEEISKNVAAISTVTTQSTKGAEQMAVSAERLNQQADGLLKIANQFTLRDGRSISVFKAQPEKDVKKVDVGKKTLANKRVQPMV